MVERLVILAPTTSAADARSRLTAAGGLVRQAYGAVWIVDVPPDADPLLPQEPGVRAVFAGSVPDDAAVVDDLDESDRLGIAAWNLRQSESFRATRATRKGEGRSWGDGVEPEG